jgi:hypothetical protein
MALHRFCGIFNINKAAARTWLSMSVWLHQRQRLTN